VAVPVNAARGTPENPVPATVANAAEFLDVEVDQVAGALVLASGGWVRRWPGRRPPGGATPWRTRMRCAVDGAMPVRAAGRTGPMRCARRRAGTCASICGGVRLGL